MNRLFNFFDKRKTPVWQKRKFFEALGIPPELAAQSGSELAKVFREEFEREAAHPVNVPLMKALDEAFTHLEEAQADFWRDMTNTFGDRAVTVIDTFADAVHKIGDAIKYVDDNAPSWWKKTDEFLEKTGKVPTDPKEQLLGPTLPNGKTPFADLRDQIKDGMIAALQWLKSNSTGDAEKLFPGGYVPMAYHPDAGVAGFARRAFGGGGYKLLPNGDEGGNLPGAPPEGSNADRGVGGVDLGAGGNVSGSPFDRTRFAKELAANPALREKIFQLAAGEDRPSKGQSLLANQAVMETMMNRAAVRGTTLAAQAKWYGREAGGYYAGRPSVLTEHERQMSEENLRKVLAGSNITDFATDNSSQGLAARERATGKFKFHRSFHGESFFSPGWAEPALQRKYAAMREQMVRALASNPHAHLRDHIRHHGSALNNAKQSGLIGGGDHKVTGDASLTIDLNGFPKGTRYASKADGMFKKVQLNRGRPMQLASQDG